MIDRNRTYEILKEYIENLDKLGYVSEFYGLNKLPKDKEQSLNYCMWMLYEMQDMLFAIPFLEGKFFRWLGFIQGVLWDNHIYTIDKFMKDNKIIIGS